MTKKEETLNWLSREKESAICALGTEITEEQRERLDRTVKAISMAATRIKNRKNLGDVEATLNNCYSQVDH